MAVAVSAVPAMVESLAYYDSGGGWRRRDADSQTVTLCSGSAPPPVLSAAPAKLEACAYHNTLTSVAVMAATVSAVPAMVGALA